GIVEGTRRGDGVADRARDGAPGAERGGLAGGERDVRGDRAQDVVDEAAGPGEAVAVVGDRVGVGDQRAVAHRARGGQLGDADVAGVAGRGHGVAGGGGRADAGSGDAA